MSFADVNMYLPAKIFQASRPSLKLLDSPHPPQEDQVNSHMRYFDQLFAKLPPFWKIIEQATMVSASNCYPDKDVCTFQFTF